MEDYESDPDDTIVPMRRREASDDEDERPERRDRREELESDEELDGQGGAGAYEDEYEEEGEEYDEYDEREVGEEVVKEEVTSLKGSGKEADEDLEGSRKEGEEKKDNEPFSVPTAGAFYMHDDRFRDNGRGRGRGRRMPGGGRIWESKDEHAWVHDRFEEMSLHGIRGRQNSRGRFRGRGGKNQSGGRGYVKDNRLRNQYDGNSQFRDDKNRNSGGNNQYHDGREGNNHNRAEKPARGRGSRRYVPRRRNEPSPSQYKQSNSQELASQSNMVRQSSHSPNVQPDLSCYAKKNVIASSLNSASPPFYPSGKQEMGGSTLRGKAVVGHNKGYIDDPLRSRYQGRSMPAVRISTQHVVHEESSANVNISEMVEIESPTGSNKSNNNNISEMVAKGDGRGGSFVYNGNHNDQSFSPALLPVMQFGGQQHGVPAVGMAFPGYVAQPQLGFQNSEMTWVPLLAGAAAGASYHQYIPLDETTYPLGQTSLTCRETGVINSPKPSQLSEAATANEEYEQRHNKPRRYSKMSFGQ